MHTIFSRKHESPYFKSQVDSYANINTNSLVLNTKYYVYLCSSTTKIKPLNYSFSSLFTFTKIHTITNTNLYKPQDLFQSNGSPTRSAHSTPIGSHHPHLIHPYKYIHKTLIHFITALCIHISLPTQTHTLLFTQRIGGKTLGSGAGNINK